jgi:uncharacterized protein
MRRTLSAALFAWTLVPLAACQSGPQVDPAARDVEAATQEIETWRAGHEDSYRGNYAMIAGLHFLEPGAHTAGSAETNAIVLPASMPAVVGRFVLEDDAVRFEPAAGTDVQVNGRPIAEPVTLRDDSNAERDELTHGDVRIAVHRSGDRHSLRVWGPNGEQARGFSGFTWFPIDMSYRVTGRFIPDATPRELPVVNTFGDTDTYATEGVVEFTLQGETLRLRPFTTRPNRFFFVFRDASSGEETYEAARFLYADLRADGTAVLDFNQAYNPPCAFNPYTTCPIPLRENRLTRKILAGEQDYVGQLASAR